MYSESHYQAYVLRLWQVPLQDQPGVLATLDHCLTKEHHAFTSLADLIEFLATDPPARPPAAPEDR